jgi:hypothetical protein
MTITTTGAVALTTRPKPLWFEADPANVGLKARLPSGAVVMLMRPLQRNYGCWDCAYLDELGRVRMVRDKVDSGAHSVSLTSDFLSRHAQVVA